MGPVSIRETLIVALLIAVIGIATVIVLANDGGPATRWRSALPPVPAPSSKVTSSTRRPRLASSSPSMPRPATSVGAPSSTRPRAP